MLVICIGADLILPSVSFISLTELVVVACHLTFSILNLRSSLENSVECSFAEAIYAIYLRVEDEVFGAAGMVAFAAEDHVVQWAGQAFVFFARSFRAAADITEHFALEVSARYSMTVISPSQLTSSGSEMGHDGRLKILTHCYNDKCRLMAAKRIT